MKQSRKNCCIKKRRWQWLLSIGLTAVLFLITFATTPIIFSTNDDTRILYTLAGYNTGFPHALQPFINSFLGKAISLFYRWFPELSWYGIFHVACLFIGTAVIGKCLLKNAARKKLHVFIPLLLQIFLFYACYIFVVVGMQFSTTPALLGSSAVALLLCIDTKRDSKLEIGIDISLSLLLLLVCMMTRSFTWYCIMCFYALAAFYQFLRAFPAKNSFSVKWRWILVVVVIAALVSGIGIRQVSLYIKDVRENNPEYEEYNDYRVKFQDYKMRPAYDDTPQLYQDLGWNKNTYRALTATLLFFDRNMNADDLRVITQAYEEADTSKRTWDDTVETALDVLDDYNAAKCALAAVIVLALMCMAASICNRNFWKLSLCALFALLGYVLMYLVLSYNGRFLIRIFETITIPACTFLAVALCKLINRKKLKSVFGVLLSVAFTVIILVLCVFNIHTIYFTDEYTKTQTKTTATAEQFRQFEEYAMDNPDNVYVYDFSTATVHRDPFVVYPDEKPTNCIISGGSYIFSTIYDIQLEANGLQSLYWEDFLRDDVYFASAGKNFVGSMADCISDTVKAEIAYEEVHSFGEEGIKVYKFFIAE